MNLEPTVLFEDETVLVLNKPAGWVVNRSESTPEITMQDWLEKYYLGNAIWEAGLAEDPIFFDRSGLAHRLDRDTSGVLVVGKTPAAMHELLSQFKERKVTKSYQALAHGTLPAKAGIVNAPILRDPEVRTRFIVAEGGRDARTIFHVAEEYKGFDFEQLREAWVEKTADKPLQKLIEQYQGFSLVSLQPKTGRTHQIRVHLRFLGNPIVGDRRYNSPKRSFLDANWCPRQFLHASQIVFFHPITGEEKTVQAPLPPDLVKVLSLLDPR